jgi:uncharacterized protein YkuJ
LGEEEDKKNISDKTPGSGDALVANPNSGAVLEPRLSALENKTAEIEKQLKTIKENQPSKISIWLGMIGGVLGIIAGLTSIPKNVNDASRAMRPRQTTVTWGHEIEIAYSPNQLAFTLELIASNDGDQTDRIDTVSVELKSPKLPEPVFITKDDIRTVQTNETMSNAALRTPVFIAAKQPTDLRIAAVVTASSDAVLSSSEPQILKVSITLEGGKRVNTEYCIPVLDDEDRKALREGKPRRVLIGTDTRTFARVGDVAEGVKLGDPSGTYVLNLKPETPPNDQGQNVVVFFNDARRHYEAIELAQHSCGSSNVGWVRLKEKDR